jgi:hypothetical protein
MGFVVKRRDKFSARLSIPRALRPILGQNEFKKSLGTSNKTGAELRAAPLVLHWKKLIEDAKTDGVIAKAKIFFDIASGQVTTLDDYVDGWLLSIEHLEARTIKHMKRDVYDFLKEERIQLPTRKSGVAWIRRSNDISPKSIKRKVGSLGSSTVT